MPEGAPLYPRQEEVRSDLLILFDAICSLDSQARRAEQSLAYERIHVERCQPAAAMAPPSRADQMENWAMAAGAAAPLLNIPAGSDAHPSQALRERLFVWQRQADSLRKRGVLATQIYNQAKDAYEESKKTSLTEQQRNSALIKANAAIQAVHAAMAPRHQETSGSGGNTEMQ